MGMGMGMGLGAGAWWAYLGGKLKPNVKTVQTRSSTEFHCDLPEPLPIPAIQFYSILFYSVWLLLLR